MNATDGLSFATGIDTSGFRRGAAQLQNIIDNTGAQLSGQLGNAIDLTGTLENSFKRLASAVGIGLSVQQAWNFASTVRDVRAEIQSLEISFETLLGSKEKADALFGSIREFAVNTPMQLKDLASAAQTMLSFNIDESKVMDYLKALGDVSMGDTQKFQGLALAFSQMSSAGKLMGQDFMQMVGQGFNPLAVMAEKTGKSINELKEEMSAGKISAEMVQQAFIDATSEGGKFYNMLEKQSHGIAGAMSNLQGAIDDMFNELGESSEGLITGAYTAATEIVKNWKEVAEAIGVAVAAYGVYKAAVMTDTAIKTTATAVQYEAEAAELEKIIALKNAEMNTDLQAAVSSGKLSASKAEAIAASRAEAAAVVESLQAKAAAAKIDVQTAITAEASAKQKWLASVEVVKAKQAELLAAEQSGDGFAIATAKEELNTACDQRNAAAAQYNAATKDVKTKKQIADTAATTADTAATQLNTAAETGNTAATNFLTAAKTRLIAVVAKLRAAMLAHPYALIAAAVAVLVYAIYKLCTAQSDAEKAQKRLNDAMDEANASADAEVEHFKYLFNQIKKTKEGTEEFKAAKDKLIEQYGSYFTNIDIEHAKIKDLEAAYDDLTASVRRSARERAMEGFIKDEGKNYADDMGEYFKEAREAAVAAYGEEWTKKNEDAIRRIVSGEAAPSKQFLAGFTKNKNDFSGMANFNKFTGAMDKGKKRTEIWNKSVAEAEYKFGDYSKPEEKPSEPTKNKKYWEDQKKNAQSRLDALSSIAAIGKEGQKIRKEIAGYEKELKAYETPSKSGGGSSGPSAADLAANADAASEKLTAEERKQAKERKRIIEDMEMDLWQSRIDAGEFGTDKYIQQRDLDFKKEQTELQRQMEDAIDAEVARQKALFDAQEDLNQKEAAKKKKKKKYTKKAFNSDNLSGMEFTPGTTFDDEKIGDVDMASINAISEQYGALQQQMLAKQAKVVEQEDRRQRQAMNEYLLQWGDYAEKRQAIIDTASDKLNDPDANLTDGEKLSILQQMNKDLAELRNNQQQAMNEYLAQWGDYAQKRQAIIDTANAKMAKAQTQGEKSSIAAQLTKDLANLDMEATKTTNAISKLFADMEKKTTKELRTLADNGQKALDMLESDEYDADLGEQLHISEEVWETLKKSPDELEKIRKAIKSIKDEADNVDAPLKKVSEGLNKVFSASDKESLKKGLALLNDGLSETLGFVNTVSTSLSQLGEAFDATALKSIAKGASIASDALGSAMSGAQAGAAFGPWGAAAGAAIGLVGSLSSSLSKLHDAKHEKRIQDIADQIETLDKAYSNLGDKIEKSYSKDASNLIEQNNQILAQKRALIQQQIAEEQQKKNSDSDRIEQWQEQIEEINKLIEENKEKAIDAIFGEDLQSAIENFADAYADAWAQGENRAKSAKDTVRTMMKQMVQESIKAAIKSSAAMEEIRNKLKDFYTDNVLSDWEQEYVYTMAEKLQKELDQQFSWAEALLNDKSYQQDGSKSAFQSMSEETGEELNGRFTAMLASMEDAKSISKEIKVTASNIGSNVVLIRANLEEMQYLAQLQLGQLQAINDNTKELAAMSDMLERIDRNIQKL